MTASIYTITIQVKLEATEVFRIENYHRLDEDRSTYNASIIEYLNDEKFSILKLDMERQ